MPPRICVPHTPPGLPWPCSTQTRFTNVLASRVNGDFLDLKGLSRDPGLVGMHVDFTNRSFVALLLKIIKQNMPQVRAPR